MAQEKVRVIKRLTRPLKSILRSGDQDDFSAEITSLIIEYNDRNHPVTEQKFDESGEPEEVHHFVYDDRGHLIAHTLELPVDGIFERFNTTRNADGLPIEIIKYYGDDAGERVVYEYGAHALPVLITRHDADGEFESKEELEYNDRKELVLRTVQEASGERKRFVFKYNEKGLLVTEEEWNGDDHLSGKVEYAYNEDGREVAVNKTNAEGKLVNTIRSEYDENGRLVRRVSKGFYTRISTFEYDEEGRLLEESLSDDHGFVISRHRMEYDERGVLVHESVYETDLTRAGRDTHLAHRYEYEFFGE